MTFGFAVQKLGYNAEERGLRIKNQMRTIKASIECRETTAPLRPGQRWNKEHENVMEAGHGTLIVPFSNVTEHVPFMAL
jgi:hypothetical protein